MLDVTARTEACESNRRGDGGGCEVGGVCPWAGVQKFEAAMAEYCGVEHAVGCASGSDALLLALMALDIGPGDEVIVPSFTFFATASAVWRLGAKPVFADISARHVQPRPGRCDYKLSTATKAIIPVHLFGQCADMDAIGQIAGTAGHSDHRGRVPGDRCRVPRPARGVDGPPGCFSFYPTKNLGGFGDGGLITTNDASWPRSCGASRSWPAAAVLSPLVGINSRLDSLQAAVLNVKLPHLDRLGGVREQHADATRRNSPSAASQT